MTIDKFGNSGSGDINYDEIVNRVLDKVDTQIVADKMDKVKNPTPNELVVTNSAGNVMGIGMTSDKLQRELGRNLKQLDTSYGDKIVLSTTKPDKVIESTFRIADLTNLIDKAETDAINTAQAFTNGRVQVAEDNLNAKLGNKFDKIPDGEGFLYVKDGKLIHDLIDNSYIAEQHMRIINLAQNKVDKNIGDVGKILISKADGNFDISQYSPTDLNKLLQSLQTQINNLTNKMIYKYSAQSVINE